MNRKQRRAAKSRERRPFLKFSEIDSKFDIQVDGKYEQVVMVFASPKGRKVVEDQWPDVEWSTDKKFAAGGHPADWLFTHIRVTRLPPHLEKAVPLAFASAESLGYAVALALHRRAWPLQVAWFSGDGTDITINTFGEGFDASEGADWALYAEYMPPRPIPSGLGPAAGSA